MSPSLTNTFNTERVLKNNDHDIVKRYSSILWMIIDWVSHLLLLFELFYLRGLWYWRISGRNTQSDPSVGPGSLTRKYVRVTYIKTHTEARGEQYPMLHLVSSARIDQIPPVYTAPIKN